MRDSCSPSGGRGRSGGGCTRSGFWATEGTPTLGSVVTIRVVRHPGGSLGRVVIAWQPGRRGRYDDGRGARGSEGRPLHRCVQAGSWVARPVRATPKRASTLAPAREARGSQREGPSGRARSESRAIAVRVRSWTPIGVLRIPVWLQKSSSDVRPREAIAVAAEVGDGGLAVVGRPAGANGVARERHRRRCRTRTARGEPLDGGRRLGPWQPSPSRGSGESGLGDPEPRGDPPAPGHDGGVRAAAGALPRSANSRPQRGPSRAKRATRRELRDPRRAIVVTGRSRGAHL